MTKRSTSKLEPIDPKIERIFCSFRILVQNKIAIVKEKPMEEQLGINAPVGANIRAGVSARAIQNASRSLMGYAQPSLAGIKSCITRSTIQAENFVLKPSYIIMI